MFYRFVWIVCSLVLRIVFGFRTHGRRNVPPTGGVILATNHQSYLDPIVAGCGLIRPVHFMARDTLFWSLFGTLIRALNAFPITRGSADVQAMKDYIARVKQGNVVLLFPEGTRSSDGRVKEFKAGVGMLAVRAGAPVVPTYVAGTFDAWPRQRSLPRRARISIYYGPPIWPDARPGESKRARQERLTHEIASRMYELEARFRGRGRTT